ncbi:MAG: hypothetical protein H0T76_24495, partial [Nannocystis sp.]|nr:hypothetical protein [Nannocystis sp.]
MNGYLWWRRVVANMVLVSLAGCAGPARTEGEPPPAAAAPSPGPAPAAATSAEAAPADGEERRYTGVLHYTELPKSKSVEAYMGREFSLDAGGDGSLNIKASAAVSEEQLRALDGATITVRARYHPASKPDPMES